MLAHPHGSSRSSRGHGRVRCFLGPALSDQDVPGRTCDTHRVCVATMGVVEAVNGNIKSLLRRGRGQNLHYLLLKAQRMAATNTEFVDFRKAA